MYWHYWPYNRRCLYHPVNPYMGMPLCPPQYPVSPGMEFPQYPPQYPVAPGMEFPQYPPQYPVAPGMEFPQYPPQYPVAPGMEFPQYPPGPAPGEEDVLPPTGPVAGEQDEQQPAGSPYIPAPWPMPSPAPGCPAAPGVELPPMPSVPWMPSGATAPVADYPCSQPFYPGTPYQPPSAGPVTGPAVTAGNIEPTESIAGGPPMPGSPEFPEFSGTPLPAVLETSGELVEVEPGEATPGEPEAMVTEGKKAAQLLPGALLGTLEGVVSAQIGDRSARPLTNQLMLMYNRATGERFQAYTDNQGYYSRRVPEGRYIVQTRQRICAPFVRQGLARVQALRRTVANMNILCTGTSAEISDQKKTAKA